MFSLTERYKGYVDELVKEIASMIVSMCGSGLLFDVPDQLYALIFQVKKTTLIRNGTRLLQQELRWEIGISHVLLAEAEERMKAEDYSELKNQQETYEEFLAGLENAQNIRWIPDHDALLQHVKDCTAARTELEDIAEMTDVTEQAEAFADYYAKGIMERIRHYLAWIAFGDTLGTENIQPIIQTEYLDMVDTSQLEELARIFGRHDLLEKYESPTDKMSRRVKESMRTKLLTVLSNRIAHKSQQVS